MSMTPLVFLLKLAWDCRYRLPLLITVGFMVLDVRMQLDINVQTRRIPRPPRPRPRVQPMVPPTDDAENHDNDGDDIDNVSESSWTTLEEHGLTDEEA